MKKYGVSLRIQSKYGEKPTRKSANTDKLFLSERQLAVFIQIWSCKVLMGKLPLKKIIIKKTLKDIFLQASTENTRRPMFLP